MTCLTMQTVCVKIAIMPKVGPRKPPSVNTQTGPYTPRVSVKIATSVFIIRRRDLLIERITRPKTMRVQIL